MSTATANTLTTGSKIYYKNMTNLQNYQASVAAITVGKTLTVQVTTPSTTIIFPLGGDGTCEIPISALN